MPRRPGITRKRMGYESAKEKNAAVILVEDTVYAMGDLARYYLDTLDVTKDRSDGKYGQDFRAGHSLLCSMKIPLRQKPEKLQ